MPNLPQRRSSDPSFFADPFADIKRELDEVFERFVGEGFMSMPRPFAAAPITPQLDIRMNDGQLQLEVDLPGVEPDNVDITLQEGMLTIKGERQEERKSEEGDVHVRERRFGRFERRVRLPDGIDEDSLEARFEKGVLSITARLKKGVEQQRRIRIAGAGGGKARELPGRQGEQRGRSAAEKTADKAETTSKTPGTGQR